MNRFQTSFCEEIDLATDVISMPLANYMVHLFSSVKLKGERKREREGEGGGAPLARHEVATAMSQLNLTLLSGASGRPPLRCLTDAPSATVRQNSGGSDSTSYTLSTYEMYMYGTHHPIRD